MDNYFQNIFQKIDGSQEKARAHLTDKIKAILGDSPTSQSRSYQLPMLLPCQQQAAPGGQNVIGGTWAL